jgi:hypothetical protein
MKTSKAIVVVLTITVALVFLAPLVNLQPTALRAAKAALALFAALAGSVLLHEAAWRQLAVGLRALLQKEDPQPSDNVLDLICSRLC